jgi:predicted oxidoreductase
MLSDFPLQRHIAGASRLVLGCMGFGGGWDHHALSTDQVGHAQAAAEAALAAGITVFDHADIYTLGKAEQAFGELFKAQPSLRDRMLLQSKCGIRFQEGDKPGRYDLSASYIERSVEASLQRLHTDRLDLLLLHRPDPLIEPDEVAAAFGRLHSAGKVRYFGVSNMPAATLAWLQQHCSFPIVVNQVEMSLLAHDWLEAGTTFNDPQSLAPTRAPGWPELLAHCQQQGVQLQAWGALAKGQLGEGSQHAAAICLGRLAAQYEAPREAVLLAWLMRHPARIQPVIGTTNPQRIADCASAMHIELSRDDWYALYVAARGRPLP